MGFNLPVKLPVTIGTIPLGASLPKQESQPAPGRDGLKYEMCQYGIQVTWELSIFLLLVWPCFGRQHSKRNLSRL